MSICRCSKFKIGCVAFDRSRVDVVGPIVSVSHYYAIILKDGKRYRVPHEQVRYGRPDAGIRKQWFNQKNG